MNIRFGRRHGSMAGNSPMIFCTWDYRNEPIFRPQSQCDAESSSVFAFQAAVHKQTNVIQHLSASTRTAPNFLASESFPWLWDVLKWLIESLMIVPILFDFDKSLDQVMPSILHLRNLLSSIAMPVFDVKITVLEALKPLTICSFTNSGLTPQVLESIRWASAADFHIEAEN